jgi:sugar phosphate isomerase/epimerase
MMIIGAQGFTVRDFAKDEEGVRLSFQKLAQIGFTSMQYSAMAPVAAEILRDLSQEHQIEITVTHANTDRILCDTEALIEEHRIFGCHRIGIGYMPPKYHGSLEGVRAFIRDFTPAAVRIADKGMKIHYHNHAFEYEKFDGKVLFDVMMEEMLPHLFSFIPDVYWIQVGGRCPAKQLEMLTGRVEVAHFKDMTIVNNTQKMAPVMEGNLCWDEIVAACRKTGVHLAMIEQDDCNGLNPFDCLETSLINLRRAGYAIIDKN